MAEVAAGFLGPAIEVVKWVGAPILRQFKYLCCFTTNITNLKNEAQKLQDTERDLQGKVDAARNDVRLISSEVETWLWNSKQIKDENNGIINEVSNVEGGCLKLRARFYLSKRAKKTADRLKELREQCKFNTDAISRPRPPAATEVVPSKRTYNFDSRKKFEEDIMTTLRGGDVNMMGICGMGGLGKTTMAKRIMNRALKEHVFEEVVMAVVSRPIEELKIQLEIGGSLGLKLEGKSLQTRVQKLHARLSGPKRILLVLDDVWERFHPEDLGIPCDNKGCTILLTSRNRDVLSTMNVQKIFRMEVLSEEDSWFLFKEGVGTCVDDTKLNSIAKEVVNECKGLPIALTTVGEALKDNMDVPIWEDALEQLRDCDPDIPEIIANIYNPLRLSYDALGSKQKSVFLLCCLFPEDADIPLELLTYFSMGLGIFGTGIRNVLTTRNKMRALTHKLKSRSLLLDSEDGDDYVRMHDVTRDVCIFIAKKEGYISDNDCTWTSSLQKYELPSGLGLLRISDSSNKEFKFDGIRDLRVLSIEKCSLTFTQTPKNLITLVLVSCYKLETLSVVGELVSLEILICRDCNWIRELPPGIKGLNRLKVLDLTKCRNLQRIGRGIISSLVGLEELKMLESFKNWEAGDIEERGNVWLRELEALTKLRCLEIDIQDPALAAENICLSSKVDRFTIRFLCKSYWFPNLFDISLPKKQMSKKQMCLYWEGATCLGHWIKMQLLRDTEYLFLVGNGANNVDLTRLENIRMLELGECESMKNMVTTSVDDSGATVFPSIDHLMLFKLPKLEEIWDRRVSLNCFQILKELTLHDLPVLKQLWKSSQNDFGKDFVPQLEVLEIRNCEMMEQLFSWEGEDGNENNSCHITKRFPKLKKFELSYLPNLISFCQGIEGIEFPLLRRIWIKECGNMKWIGGCGEIKGMVANGVTSNENNSPGSNSNAADTIHLFCESQHVSFGCLKELEIQWNPFCSHTIHVSLFNGLEELKISECADSLSLFTSSIAGNLVNLQQLEINDCDEMVEVIKDDEEKSMSDGQRTLLFPKLHTLRLWDLPKLVSFCEWKCDVELPSLREVEIRKCPNMKNFTLGSLAAPNLESFKTDLMDYLLRVPFSTLKEISIQENKNPLNCYEIHASVFVRLEVLEINEYKGSMSLFSSLITGSLVNLTELTIGSCEKIVKVIEDEEEETEKVVSGGQRTLLFPKLQKLELWYLPKLVSFCKWKCDVELPSLRELKLHGCYNMKSCTSGLLTTPNLKSVYIDYKDFGAVKDVNDFLQQPWETSEVAQQHQNG